MPGLLVWKALRTITDGDDAHRLGAFSSGETLPEAGRAVPGMWSLSQAGLMTVAHPPPDGTVTCFDKLSMPGTAVWPRR